MAATEAPPRVRFELFQLQGDYWFRFMAEHGELLLSGGPRRDLEACLDSVAELSLLCRAVAWFHARRSPSGAHYFTIDLGDEILATSCLYAERRERDGKMALVRRHIVDAPVILRG